MITSSLPQETTMQQHDDPPVPTGYRLDPETDRPVWVGLVQPAAPCPPWCALEPGHRFDLHSADLADEPLQRWHRRELLRLSEDVEVAVTQGETTAPDGASDVHLDDPTVWAAVEADEMTAPVARQVGRALLEAADLVDELVAQDGGQR